MKTASGFDYKNFKIGFIPGITIGFVILPILMLLGIQSLFGWFFLIELLLLVGFDLKSRKEKSKLSFKIASFLAGMFFGNVLFFIFQALFLK